MGNRVWERVRKPFDSPTKRVGWTILLMVYGLPGTMDDGQWWQEHLGRIAAVFPPPAALAWALVAGGFVMLILIYRQVHQRQLMPTTPQPAAVTPETRPKIEEASSEGDESGIRVAIEVGSEMWHLISGAKGTLYVRFFNDGPESHFEAQGQWIHNGQLSEPWWVAWAGVTDRRHLVSEGGERVLELLVIYRASGTVQAVRSTDPFTTWPSPKMPDQSDGVQLSIWRKGSGLEPLRVGLRFADHPEHFYQLVRDDSILPTRRGMAREPKPAPARIVHHQTCCSADLELTRAEMADGRWDRITRCMECGAQVVDDYEARSKERGPEGWGVAHLHEPLLERVRLCVGSLAGDQRRIYKCLVTTPSKETFVYDRIEAGSAIFGKDPSRILPKDKDVLFYPEANDFPGSPDVAEDGVYNVEWWALTDPGPGEYLVKVDEFELRGHLVR